MKELPHEGTPCAYAREYLAGASTKAIGRTYHHDPTFVRKHLVEQDGVELRPPGRQPDPNSRNSKLKRERKARAGVRNLAAHQAAITRRAREAEAGEYLVEDEAERQAIIEGNLALLGAQGDPDALADYLAALRIDDDMMHPSPEGDRQAS